MATFNYIIIIIGVLFTCLSSAALNVAFVVLCCDCSCWCNGLLVNPEVDDNITLVSLSCFLLSSSAITLLDNNAIPNINIH